MALNGLDFAAAGAFDWYAWVILPLIIFVARVCDVTLGTLRIIFVARGRRALAPVLGFVEVLIWIVVIGQLVQHLHSVTAYLCYAGGFAAGNFFGMWLEDRLALGTYMLRVILPQGNAELVRQIHDAGFGVTCVDGQGAAGAVQLIYTVVKRRAVNQVLEIIHTAAPGAFVSIEEVRSTERGVFPNQSTQRLGSLWRKAK